MKNEVTIEDYTFAKLKGELMDCYTTYGHLIHHGSGATTLMVEAELNGSIHQETFEEFAARQAQKVGE